MSGSLYARIGRLGKGSFGEVWQVLGPGGRFALKEMDLSSMTVEDKAAAFREVEILKRVNHSLIVGFHDSCVEGDKLCIVMQLVTGGDLKQRIAIATDRLAPLDEADVWRWLMQVSSALQYLHEGGSGQIMLHRDVKPANILLKHVGPELRDAILSDLGLVKVLASGAQAQSQCGTPLYFAPEVHLGKRYSTAADIFSLGVVVYQMCSLKTPWNSREGLVRLAHKVCREPPGPLPGHCNRALRHLVELLLSKVPTSRPSAREIIDWARQTLTGHGQDDTLDRTRLKANQDEDEDPTRLQLDKTRRKEKASRRLDFDEADDSAEDLDMTRLKVTYNGVGEVPPAPEIHWSPVPTESFREAMNAEALEAIAEEVETSEAPAYSSPALLPSPAMITLAVSPTPCRAGAWGKSHMAPRSPLRSPMPTSLTSSNAPGASCCGCLPKFVLSWH